MTKIITHKLLISWDPCPYFYKRYCQLFPKGADLKSAVDGLLADGHRDWAAWLFHECREKNLFTEYIKGFRNAGYGNRGAYNAGHCNTGAFNTGNNNTGAFNTGSNNTGNCNTSYRNTGYGNAGAFNTGNWNTGDYNTGHCNSITPDTILVFNKPCKREDWNRADKPHWMHAYLTDWICESDMSDKEKELYPSYTKERGYLRVYLSLKHAYVEAWEEASPEDRELTRKLPNFDEKVFEEVFGFNPWKATS